MEVDKIYNMDCLEGLKQIEDNSIDLIVTDPPYEQCMNGGGNIAKKYDYRKEELLKISKFNPIPFLEAIRYKMKTFNMYVWTSKNLLDIYINFAKENKFNWDILVYTKNNPIPAYNNSYLSDIEYCVFIRDKGATFNNGLNYDMYRKVMRDNLNQNMKIGHPTVKHLWMIEKLIKVSSKQNDIVLDCFMGSGTTAVACKKLNRRFIGFEISKEYCNIANERINKTKVIKEWF